MTINQKILKAVLLLRNYNLNRYSTKEEQIAEQFSWYKKGYTTEEQIDEWIEELKKEIAKTPEQREKESKEFIEHLYEQEWQEAKKELEDKCYTSSATNGDYSPSHPWDAPGMCIGDFI